MATIISDYVDEVTLEMQVVAREWFDGADSALYQLWFGKPLNAAQLLREANECISLVRSSENSKDSASFLIFQSIAEFANKHLKRDKAIKSLRKAVSACVDAGVEDIVSIVENAVKVGIAKNDL